MKKYLLNIILVKLLIFSWGCSKHMSKDFILTKEKLKDSYDNSVYINEKKDEINKTVNSFKDVFSRYKKEELANSIKDLYAKDAFINDRIHIVQGQENIKSYFLGTFDKILAGEFITHEVVYGKKDAYLRWTMVLYTKSRSNPWEFEGMSQLRFNESGKIIFHLDHWDYAELMEKLPVVGGVVRYVRSKS